jgi:hypothetical protein
MLSLNSKHMQHVKIYLACNFKVNLITHLEMIFEVNLITGLGVIALFSLFFFSLNILSDISKTIRDKG